MEHFVTAQLYAEENRAHHRRNARIGPRDGRRVCSPRSHRPGLWPFQEIGRPIADFLVGKPCRMYFAPFDVRLPRFVDEPNDDVETVVQPDIVVMCDRSKLDDRGARGAPDWIIEILSPSTAVKDLKIKHELYERHGVRELWFVHPTDRTVMVSVLGTDRAFGKPRFYGPEDKTSSSVLPDLEIDLMAVFAAAES